MAEPELLTNQVRTYAWGSRTFLPGLLGRPVPSDEPWAEMWIGAHPFDPSRLADGRSLVEVEPQLPFLVKLLAAEAPLSIQAHPNLAQARAGYAAEEAAGIPRESPTRSYKDANHKPELLVALTPAAALCGFRSPDEIEDLAARWGSPRWSSLVSGLAAVAGPADVEPVAGEALRSLFAALVRESGEALAGLLGEVVDGAHRQLADPSSPERAAATWVLELAERHPVDPGVVSPLLLRLVELEPGEGLFVAAGVLHSYLRGAGVEVQATSDNVLRAGLTPKKIDLPELLQVLVGDHRPAPLVHPRALAPGLDTYEVPVDDFAVWRVTATGAAVEVPAHAPVIAVCVDGQVEVGGLALGPGAAAYLPAGSPYPVVTGRGTCFLTASGVR